MTGRNRGGHPVQHNHVTMDIKPTGECPACDEYYHGRSVSDSRTRGEPGDAERARLAQELEAGGHSGCAYDLQHADEIDVVDIAYQVADHVEEACGDDFAADPELAERIRTWARTLSRVDPAVARKGKIPVTVHRNGGQVFVNLNPDDFLDLAREGDVKVTVVLGGEPVMNFERLDTPGENGQRS